MYELNFLRQNIDMCFSWSYEWWQKKARIFESCFGSNKIWTFKEIKNENGLLFAQTLCLKNVNVSLNFFMKNSQFFPTVSTTYIHKKRTNNLYKALIQHPSKKLQTYRILTDFESWSFLDCLIRLFRPPYVKTFSVQFFFSWKNLHFLTHIYEMWRSKQNQAKWTKRNT